MLAAGGASQVSVQSKARAQEVVAKPKAVAVPHKAKPKARAKRPIPTPKPLSIRPSTPMSVALPSDADFISFSDVAKMSPREVDL
eukprot:7847185-Karenia_brevis.AAC.1